MAQQLQTNEEIERIIKGPHMYRDGIYVSVPSTAREYPKWKYHAIQSAILVRDAAQEAKLGLDWFDVPQDATPAAKKEAGIPVSARAEVAVQSTGIEQFIGPEPPKRKPGRPRKVVDAQS